jgi:hypothetical protein
LNEVEPVPAGKEPRCGPSERRDEEDRDSGGPPGWQNGGDHANRQRQHDYRADANDIAGRPDKPVGKQIVCDGCVHLNAGHPPARKRRLPGVAQTRSCGTDKDNRVFEYWRIGVWFLIREDLFFRIEQIKKRVASIWTTFQILEQRGTSEVDETPLIFNRAVRITCATHWERHQALAEMETIVFHPHRIWTNVGRAQRRR